MNDIEHSIRIHAGYDHRDDPSDRRGAHGAELILIAKGPLGAISCTVGTGWMSRPLAAGFTRRVPQERRANPGVDAGVWDVYPTGSYVHLHSPTQARDYWHQVEGPCEYVGEVCYSDMGYVIADSVLEALVSGGDEAAFARLDEIYADWLGPEVSS